MQAFIFLALAFFVVKNDHICDLELLKLELGEDIDDNGVLDCLRRIDPPNMLEETDS